MTILLIFFSDLKGVPRTEATQIVGSLLAFPPILHNIPLLLPNPNELSLISSADVKDQIVGVLLKSGKKEPAGKIIRIFIYPKYVIKTQINLVLFLTFPACF